MHPKLYVIVRLYPATSSMHVEPLLNLHGSMYNTLYSVHVCMHHLHFLFSSPLVLIFCTLCQLPLTRARAIVLLLASDAKHLFHVVNATNDADVVQWK